MILLKITGERLKVSSYGRINVLKERSDFERSDVVMKLFIKYASCFHMYCIVDVYFRNKIDTYLFGFGFYSIHLCER